MLSKIKANLLIGNKTFDYFSSSLKSCKFKLAEQLLLSEMRSFYVAQAGPDHPAASSPFSAGSVVAQ